MTGAPGDLRGIIPRVNEALHGAIHLGVSSAIGGYYSIAEWFISSKILENPDDFYEMERGCESCKVLLATKQISDVAFPDLGVCRSFSHTSLRNNRAPPAGFW